jgi:hypothetical protein
VVHRVLLVCVEIEEGAMTRYRFPKECRCGSGLLDFELLDAAGIFCAYVCEKCEGAARARFDPAIFDSRSTYSETGEEIDIGRFPGEDY